MSACLIALALTLNGPTPCCHKKCDELIYRAELRFVEADAKGHCQAISQPRVSVLAGQPATVMIGQSFPVVNGTIEDLVKRPHFPAAAPIPCEATRATPVSHHKLALVLSARLSKFPFPLEVAVDCVKKGSAKCYAAASVTADCACATKDAKCCCKDKCVCEKCACVQGSCLRSWLKGLPVNVDWEACPVVPPVKSCPEDLLVPLVCPFVDKAATGVVPARFVFGKEVTPCLPCPPMCKEVPVQHVKLEKHVEFLETGMRTKLVITPAKEGHAKVSMDVCFTELESADKHGLTVSSKGCQVIRIVPLGEKVTIPVEKDAAGNVKKFVELKVIEVRE